MIVIDQQQHTCNEYRLLQQLSWVENEVDVIAEEGGMLDELQGVK